MCRKKPPQLGLDSPLSYCFWGGEAVTKREAIVVNGEVVDPYLGPKGRPLTWKVPEKIPLGPLMHMHRECLRDLGESPWWSFLRAWEME